MKKPDMLLRITPVEMFSMIQDFADGLLDYVKEQDFDEELPLDCVALSEKILNIFRETETEGRIGIIVLLQTACAMYEMALEQKSQSCPKPLLN